MKPATVHFCTDVAKDLSPLFVVLKVGAAGLASDIKNQASMPITRETDSGLSTPCPLCQFIAHNVLYVLM